MCRRKNIIDKISTKVDIIHLGFEIEGVPSPCHIWTGPNSGDGRGGGYPRMSLDGQTVAVHLVVYTHHFGFIPGKKQIDHRCNNRLCVNQEHLQMVTHRKNQQLRAARTKEKVNASVSAFNRLPSFNDLVDAASYRGSSTEERSLSELRPSTASSPTSDDFQRQALSASVSRWALHQAGQLG